MPKRASGRKKGIRRNIPRHRVGSKKRSDGEDGVGHETEDNVSRKFRLMGFTRTSSGEYVLSDTKDQILHYVTIVLYLAFTYRNTMQTMSVLLNEDLGVKSFLCLSQAATFFIPLGMSVGVVLRPKETADVLNSWSYVSFPTDSGPKFHPLNDKSASLKVIAAFTCCYGITSGAAIVSILRSDLPTCVFPILERFGLIPEGILPRFAWQLLFAPVQWILYLPPMAVAHFGGCIVFMGNGAIQIYMEPLKKIRVRSMESRERLERMYVQLELFNRIFQVWIRFFFPTWLLGYATCVVIALFITIRYTELPLILYIVFPYAAVSVTVLMFWQSFDMLRVGRESEDILGVLLQQQAPYLRNKTRKERVEVMKRARTLRPVSFPLADCEFSINLPMSAWEEILNQVVFLLSF